MHRTMILVAAVVVFVLIACHPATAGQTYDIDAFIAKVPSWVEQFRTDTRPGAYGYLPGKKQPDVYGATDMVFLLYTLDMLDLTDKQRQSWVAIIQSFQNPKTGWFVNTANLHAREHATAYAVGALKLLGAKPKYPLAYVSRFDTKAKIEKMFEAVPWEGIWSGSHIPSGIASSLINTETVDKAWMDIYLGWLDREADPATGYWVRGAARNKSAVTKDEMGGAFHFYYLYTYMKHPLPYPEKIIDATIAIQHDNGLWDADVPYCIDLDGVYGIIEAYKQLGNGYRRADVEAAVEKTLAATVSRLNDPAFVDANYKDSHKLVGAVVALAEIQAFLKDKLKTPKPLKRILPFSPFV